MNKIFRSRDFQRWMAIAGALLTVSTLLHFREIRQAIEARRLRDCIDRVPAAAGAPLVEAAPLARCAEAALRGFADSPDFAKLMEWILDARTRSDQLPGKLKASLSAVAIGIDPISPPVLALVQIGWVLGLAASVLALLSRSSAEEELRLEEAIRALLEKSKRPATPVSIVESSRVLIIDDDPRFARGAGRPLERRGFQVDYAYSARDGRKLLSDREYDCVFCDYFLDESKGTELCEQALGGREARRRCVIVSGRGPDELRGEESAFAFLPKPCSAEAMLGHALQRVGQS